MDSEQLKQFQQFQELMKKQKEAEVKLRRKFTKIGLVRFSDPVKLCQFALIWRLGRLKRLKCGLSSCLPDLSYPYVPIYIVRTISLLHCTSISDKTESLCFYSEIRRFNGSFFGRSCCSCEGNEGG